VQILVGSRTAQALAGKFALLELDRVTVKGKSEPETVYAVFGRSDLAETEEFKSLQAAVVATLKCYRAQDWDGAATALAQCGKFSRFDVGGLTSLYAERIAAFREIPPPPDWDGVYALLTK
jgi:adenylate cyclase